MTCIGDESERTCQETGDSFDDDKRSSEREPGDECPASAFVRVSHDFMVSPGPFSPGKAPEPGARVEGAAAAAVRAVPWQVNSQA